MTEQSSSGSPLRYSSEERPRKVDPNLGCPTLSWRSQRSRTKRNYGTLKVATWNVRTLMDNQNSGHSKRRTAIVARQLARYNNDIAALSEAGFSEEGKLREDCGGYIVFWKGTAVADHRIHGVGFAIKNETLRQLVGLPVGTN